MADTALSDSALLQLMQLASPALPVGGFSYSEGLETAVDAGLVHDELRAGDWLLDQLHLGLERADLPVLSAALGAWQAHEPGRVVQCNEWICLTRESAEQRLQTQQMGRSLAEWLKNRGGADDRVAQLAALRPAPTWPIAFALAAALAGAPRREALLAFGFGWAENMVQAAMRCVPLGQSAAQRILARLIAALPEAVERAAARPEEGWQAHTPGLAILSSRHETQYSRLFRS
jgi:urease accessory protein